MLDGMQPAVSNEYFTVSEETAQTLEHQVAAQRKANRSMTTQRTEDGKPKNLAFRPPADVQEEEDSNDGETRDEYSCN
jgi:hypothetical protein